MLYGQGERNKVQKLSHAKVKYIIRAKSNNISSKIIAIEIKLLFERSIESGALDENKEPLAPRNLGRPKTSLNEADGRLILENIAD